MKNKAILICTTPYFSSHRKEPRGRGSWAFALNGNSDLDDLLWAPPLDVAPYGPRTFTQAVAWIRKNAPAGTYLAEVQP